MKRKMLQVDPYKLKEKILDHGRITHVAEDLGYSPSYFTRAFRMGELPEATALMLDKVYGIKYEDYKPEEKEPVQEDEPIIETTVVSKDEALLKVIISQLSALNNGLTAIYKKLEEL